MIKQRKIELLAPAKNLECGIAAIDHGADAVYIGAPKFGARAAAVNSLEDIAALVEYAHLYNARIYVTVNTILKDEELQETEKMIWALFRAGVDALVTHLHLSQIRRLDMTGGHIVMTLRLLTCILWAMAMNIRKLSEILPK